MLKIRQRILFIEVSQESPNSNNNIIVAYSIFNNVANSKSFFQIFQVKELIKNDLNKESLHEDQLLVSSLHVLY